MINAVPFPFYIKFELQMFSINSNGPKGFHHRGFIIEVSSDDVLVHCIYISFAAFERNFFIPREQDQALTLTRHLDNR